MRALSVVSRVMALLLVVIGAAVAQPPDEQALFEAALRSLQLGAVERAEQEFTEFVQWFPDSRRLAEANLYRAQAALRQHKIDSTISLLTTNEAKAGVILDRYRYWVGEAYFRGSNYVAAAETFARMIRDFPDSPRLLSAAYGEAWARFRLREFEQAIDLLQDPEGAFQRAAYERRTDTLAIRGELLLGESYLELGDDLGAARAAARLSDRALTPELQWRRDYLLCRIELLRKSYPVALAVVSNLMSTASSCDQPQLKMAETVALHGNILEQAGAPQEATQVYTNNLSSATPPDYRRTAFLRIVELTLAQNRLTDAAHQLERFFAQYPREAASDVALLSLGELHLKQHSLAVEASRTNVNLTVPTNHLHDALSRFEDLRSNFPESPLIGQAHLHRGWCQWEQGHIAESQAAFKLALEKLQHPDYLAVARFKLADTYLRQNDYANAISHYRHALREAAGAPAINDVLSPQALHQMVRAMLATGAFKQAEETMAKLLQEFPDQPFGQSGLLLVGQGLMRVAKPAEARAVLLEFADKVKAPPLRPQVELAIARSYAEEKQWEAAAREYGRWIEQHGTNRLRPQVEFDRAWIHYLAGHETNAFGLFTNFLAQYRTHPLAPKAQFWIADFYLRHGNYTDAELHFQSTNLANVYEAKMMAGRAAFARHAYKDAKDYFTALVNDPNCPPEIAAQAFFALGDTILLGEGDPASPIQKFDDAREAFRRITLLYPSSPLVPQALGQIGNCYFQMATTDAKYYSNALNAYFAVLAPSNAAGVTTRSQAEFGIAQVLERQAKGPPERPELLKSALNYYLNIFNGKNLKGNEAADPTWAHQAGFEAARLAEEQKKWELALNIYLGLRKLAPSSRDNLERKIARLRELAGNEKS